MAYIIKDALIQIYLLEKESSDGGRDETIEMIFSYTTATVKSARALETHHSFGAISKPQFRITLLPRILAHQKGTG